MYPFERFTEAAKRTLTLAQEEAELRHQSYIGTEHLLVGLLHIDHSAAVAVLAPLGLTVESVREKLDLMVGPPERKIISQIIPTDRVKKVIQIAFEEARTTGVGHVGTGQLLMGLVVEGEGIAAHLLGDAGISAESIRAALSASTVDEGAEGAEVVQRPPGNAFIPLIERAQNLAADDRSTLDFEHLLIAMLERPTNPIRQAFAAVGVDEAGIRILRERLHPPVALLRLRLDVAACTADIRAAAASGNQARLEAAVKKRGELEQELQAAEARWREGDAGSAVDGE